MSEPELPSQQQADDTTADFVPEDLREELESAREEVARDLREREREHYDDSILHDYENPSRAAEYDYIQHAAPSTETAAVVDEKGSPAGASPRSLPSVPADATRYRFKWAREVAPETIPWIWQQRIPKSCLTILDGDPGVGKTTIVIDLMARLSSVRPMPFEDVPLAQANSLIVSVEDSVAYTIVPRLKAAGADMDRVAVVIDYPTFPSGLARLKKTVKDTQARFVMIDPGLAMFDQNINSGSDAETRRVVGGLAALAADCECAVVFVRHLNKTPSNIAMYRGGGSIAISAAARSGLLAKGGGKHRHPVLAVFKASLSLVPPTLRYQVVGSPGDPAVSVIDWMAEIGMTADQALEGDLRPEPGRPRGASSDESDEKSLSELGRESRVDAEVFTTVFMAGEKGLGQQAIQDQTKKGRKSIEASLERLVDSGKLERAQVKGEGRGRPATVWRCVGRDEGTQESFE